MSNTLDHLLQQARALLEQHQPDAAIALLHAADAPNDAARCALMAQAYFQRGDTRGDVYSSQFFSRRALALGSASPRMLAICAIANLRKELYAEAADLFARYVTENSAAAAQHLRGLALLRSGQRAAALPDGSISSGFLEMFGRPPRDTGLESERNNNPTAEQRLHMLNSSHIQLKIQQSAKLRTLVQARPGGKPRDPIDRVYLATLSRYPTDEELKTVAAYYKSVQGNKWPATADLAWALINSAEFLYRH